MYAVFPKNCGVCRAQRSHRGELTGSAAPINCPKCRSYRRAAPFVSAFSGFAGLLEAVLIAPLLPTYARADLAFERGEGAWLFGTDGKRYLDFSGGVAVNALGHAHPALVKALTEQAQKVWHVSNLFRIPEGERLAERLVDDPLRHLRRRLPRPHARDARRRRQPKISRGLRRAGVRLRSGALRRS